MLTMSLSPVSELESTLKFSDCGQYLTLFNHLFCYFFSLQSDNEVPRSFSRPSIIRSGSHGSWNHCFFKLDDGAVGWDFLRTSMYHYVQDENETLTWTTERKNLTPLPAHLVKAKATLLLGSDEYPNLRILFYQGNHPPEIKYLNITWEEFESEFDLGSSPFSRPSIPSLEDSQEPD